MAAGRAQEAEGYLKEHKIMELVNNLTSLLLYHRPERPREFLITLLEKLKLARLADVEYPCLFDESNADAVFGILDPSGQGYITGTQYIEALKTLGVDVSNLPSPPEKITQEVFKHDISWPDHISTDMI
ncbi:EF-hand calcium-binding domain-containing protein 10 isoform X2 [Hyla sarda]|uniref:EF-hand calcium-binding domain-containing protein 10 isoform X2 n=1 Tax=Hyla sarda TaxID=327740 RepID=UPI0024C2BBE6|nr:EF-hand calcium-binding domain-containing protein 10 isoform X2 [Hyla sarda]